MESYWAHRSNYQAIRYNCVTEAFELFQSVVNDPRLNRHWPLLPNEAYNLLERYGYIADNTFVKEGPKGSSYYEPSRREKFTFYLTELKEIFPDIQDNDPFEFILGNHPTSRIDRMEYIASHKELTNNLKFKYLLILEQFERLYAGSLPSHLRRIRARWFQYLPNSAHPELIKHKPSFYKVSAALRHIIENSELALSSGYGLVFKDEFRRDNWELYVDLKKKSLAKKKELYAWMEEIFPAKWILACCRKMPKCPVWSTTKAKKDF